MKKVLENAVKVNLAGPTQKPIAYLNVLGEYVVINPNFELCDALGRLNIKLPDGEYPLYLGADVKEKSNVR